MKKDELDKLKKATAEDMVKLLDDKKIELMQARAEIKAGKEKNLKKVKNLRRYVAQVKTIMRLKEIVSENKVEKEEEK